MVILSMYVITTLCPCSHARRAESTEKRITRGGCVLCAALPDSAGERPAQNGDANCHRFGLRKSDVRNVIHDFEQRGLACLVKGANVPYTVEPVLTAAKREQLQAILHQSPRTFGKPQSQWTLKLLAAVCHEQGLSPTQLSAPTILDAMVRLGSRWKRAKHWVTSPDPHYALKKTT